MTRREARERAVCYLYEYDMQPDRSPKELIRQSYEERDGERSPFAELLFCTAAEHLTEIDEKIAAASTNWKFSRIAKVTLAVLRLAVCEMCFLAEPTPTEIAVNEALEVARTFDADEALPFINGVLSKVTA